MPPTTRSRRLLATLVSLLLLAPLTSLAHATAAPDSAENAPVSAEDFRFYMHQGTDVNVGLCQGVGLNITEDPNFANNDCGYADFTLSDAASSVKTALRLDGAAEPFTTLTAVNDGGNDWQVDLEPLADWPAGLVTLEVIADGVSAGQSAFGHNLLGATLTAAGRHPAGEAVQVTGTIVQKDSGPATSTVTDGTDPGVPATFTLRATAPDGSTLHEQQVTAGDDGAISATLPAAATEGLQAGPESDYASQIRLEAAGASYRDPDSGTWKAPVAGVGTATVVSPPQGLQLDNSFVSSVGWVKPGDTYPSRVFVTNATEQPADDVTVTVPSPDGTTLTQARTGAEAGTATITEGTLTWDLGTVPAATADGPTVRTVVLEAAADTLAADPELVWKDLSTTATLSVAGTEQATSRSHGPRVIPEDATYDTARYGDRPFPVVPVDYRDRKHQASNSGQELSDKINSTQIPGSTFNLFQEMSLGQLFPEGTVPSSDIATADFGYGPGFDFTSPDPQGTCTGTTLGTTGNGSALHPERIKDGFYQLPGDTAYYGGDRYGSAVVGAVAGVGALMDIDSACGPTGKLVYDSAAISDPEIDYSDYDTDKDGVVDFFMVVFAGCGGHGASQLSVVGCDYADAPYDNVWPHSSSLEFYYTDEETGLTGYISDDQLKDLEGRPMYYTDASYSQTTTEKTDYPVYVRVGPYNVNPETAIDKASVISHEYGHSLGLPDFYSLGSRETYGDWNLMATDKSQNMDIFSRQEMGWVVPEPLEPGRTEVTGFTDSKEDTHRIVWQRPDGTPYELTGPDVHNSQAYVAKLPGRQLIDPAKFDTGDKASLSHAWWSGSGNDFGCPPQGGHNLDVVVPGTRDLPQGTTIDLSFKSLFDIEWDYDYGFVLTTTDGGESYTSQPSENGYTTPSNNPNQNACMGKYGNGLTGTSGSYTAGTFATDRLLGNYPESVFVADSYDVSELVGEDGVLRFSYATDPGLARPGWFIDDLVVTATLPDGTEQVLLESDLESSGDPDDPSFVNGGCTGRAEATMTTAKTCTTGWNYVDASSEAPADHAYYLEMRDRSGFDVSGRGENDRAAIDFQPGLSLVYTDEAHGYGNVGTDDPPAQSPLDANPQPGENAPDLADAAFTAAGVSTFSDSGTGHTDNYRDSSGDAWVIKHDCLSFEVTSMSGAGIGPEDPADGDLTGDVVFDLSDGCGVFDYGISETERTAVGSNTAPTAHAVLGGGATDPVPAGQPVQLDGTGSTDDQTPQDLQYTWDVDIATDSNGDGEPANDKDAVGALVTTTYATAGRYTARLSVTDPRGLVGTDDLAIEVTAPRSGGHGGGTGDGNGGGRKDTADSGDTSASRTPRSER